MARGVGIKLNSAQDASAEGGDFGLIWGDRAILSEDSDSERRLTKSRDQELVNRNSLSHGCEEGLIFPQLR